MDEDKFQRLRREIEQARGEFRHAMEHAREAMRIAFDAARMEMDHAREQLHAEIEEARRQMDWAREESYRGAHRRQGRKSGGPRRKPRGGEPAPVKPKPNPTPLTDGAEAPIE